MISLEDIKRKYVKLYKNLRNYIWSYEVIECLAYLENYLFHRFPDMKQCRNQLNRLYNLCKKTIEEDENLKDSFNQLKELIEEHEVEFSYVPINYLEEV